MERGIGKKKPSLIVCMSIIMRQYLHSNYHTIKSSSRRVLLIVSANIETLFREILKK